MIRFSRSLENQLKRIRSYIWKGLFALSTELLNILFPKVQTSYSHYQIPKHDHLNKKRQKVLPCNHSSSFPQLQGHRRKTQLLQKQL